jgi:steroid delta-isomerase-like uncharacterized protein
MTATVTDAERLVRLLVQEEFNTGNFAITDEIIAPDFVNHSAPQGMKHGPAGLHAVSTLFRRAFPDVNWAIDDLIAAGDRVVIRTTLTGTHQREFFGIAPTGASVSVSGMHILRIAGGRVAEHWGVNDDLSLMRQLGVVA